MFREIYGSCNINHAILGFVQELMAAILVLKLAPGVDSQDIESKKRHQKVITSSKM